MPRRKRPRKIVSPPGFRGYRPVGARGGGRPRVDLLYEEYEAMKLADYDGMKHQEAAAEMDVSRATFARIYESARQKIARALVETREIRSVFGDADLEGNWYICNSCHARFTLPPVNGPDSCPLCQTPEPEPITKSI